MPITLQIRTYRGIDSISDVLEKYDFTQQEDSEEFIMEHYFRASEDGKGIHLYFYPGKKDGIELVTPPGRSQADLMLQEEIAIEIAKKFNGFVYDMERSDFIYGMDK